LDDSLPILREKLAQIILDIELFVMI